MSLAYDVHSPGRTDGTPIGIIIRFPSMIFHQMKCSSPAWGHRGAEFPPRGGVSLGTARVRQGRESTVERCAPPCAGSGWHARRKATGVRAYGPGRVGIACLLSGGLRRPSRRRKCLPHSQRGRAHRDDAHLHDARGGRALARATFRPQLGTWRGGGPECQALAAANASRTRRVRDASVSRAVLSPPLLRERHDPSGPF